MYRRQDEEETQTGVPGPSEACHVLTRSCAQGSRGWMTVVFLFHVPQYAGR